jgi:cobalt-zinc-cadmium resistance protein CzcA
MPELAPISTGLGEIYQYVVYAKPNFEDKFDATQLRSIQDWIVKPQILGTKGVAEVSTLGGYLKQYEISVQPDKLKSMNTTITEIFEALEKNNENTGGAYIDKQPYVYFIRGLGMVKNIPDIEKIVVKNNNGIPILIRDVAKVVEGSATRYGAVTKDGKGEVVGGMVLMLKGENSAEIVNLVKQKIVQIRKSLPEGVAIEPFIDRTKLVNKAISTVQTNLLEGALIVIFVLIMLIGNWRAGLVVASVIPLALLFAVSLMKLFGVSGNLMSLGAIDFGLIVDGAVIIVEAIVHRLQSVENGKLSAESMDEEVYQATSKIRSSAAFGEIIILIVYLPILALVGIEGKMFKPMAQTVSFAILGAFLLSLTYVPMMSALFLSKKTGHENNISDKIIAAIQRIYTPILRGALRMKMVVLGVTITLFVLALLVFNGLGGEFIPTLEEGDYAINFRIPGGSSLKQSVETATKLEQILKSKFPEVVEVVSKIGAAEIPTDPMSLETGDMIVILKDKKLWTTTHDFYELEEMMTKEMSNVVGVQFEATQPIQMRFNELMTGVKSDVAIKIFGDDLDKLASTANNIMDLIKNTEGATDMKAEQVSGLPQITVRYNPDKMALYGLNVGDLNKVLRTGFAGEVSGTVYEGERRYDLVVRLAKDERQDISNVKNLFISLPTGNQIPLEQVADVTYEDGPAQVSREEGKRRIVIGLNVRGRDVKSVVDDIQNKLDAKLKLPEGYYITYGGQFENLVEANKRLSVAVPVALALIFVLLFFTFGSISQSALIFTAIPLSAIGGVFALWLRGMPFSISAGIGFIALFGVAVLNGIVLIGYFNQLKTEGMNDVLERIKVGTKVRLRPVIMTASVASLGFLPMALSSGAGAEVQKPLATVVIGGLITATFLTLIVLPILYYFFENGFKKKKKTIVNTAILLVFMLFSPKINAQTQTLNLNQAIDLAVKNNQLLQANNLDIQTAQILRGAVLTFPKTNIGASLGQMNSIRFDENFSISQDIPNPSFTKAKRQFAEVNVGLSQQRLAISKQELLFNIKQSWYQIAYFQALNQVFQREDSLLQQFVRAATLKLKTGESNLLEKTTAENKQLQLRQNSLQIINLIGVEKLKLNQLMNNANDFLIENNELKTLNFNEITDPNLINNNPLLLFAKQQIALIEAEKNVVKADALPDYKVGYFIQSLAGTQEVNGQPKTFSALPRFQGVQLGINLPLFGKSAYKARNEALNSQLLMQQKQNEYVQTQLQSQLKQAIQQYDFWKNNVVYYEKTALLNAQSIIKNATKAYQSGDIGYVEYAQALQTNLDIQKAYLEAINNVNKSVISIQFIINQ